MTQNETKHRILDAAERLFARDGYTATSLRSITVEAKANVAAIHYHFGNKQSLLEALFMRRVGAVNDERIHRLNEAEERSPNGSDLTEVLRIFLEPALRRLDSDDPGWKRFTQVMGRVLGETGDHLQAIHEVFSEIRVRFMPALQRAVPHLSEEDLAWRMHFLIGSMSFLLANPGRLCMTTEGRCDSENSDETIEQLIAYARSGFFAPSVQGVRPTQIRDAR